MRVLVSGIDGFVGSHAAEFLLGIPGVEIHGIALPGGTGKNIKSVISHLHLHEVDMVDAGAVERTIRDVLPEKILHLAGQAFVPTSLADPAGTFRTNIMGGVNLLEAVRKMQEKSGTKPTVLLISTGEVYGHGATQPVTEEAPLLPCNPYAASKVSIDLIGQEYRRTFGVDVLVARPFNHAGPRQSPVFVIADFGRQFAMMKRGKADRVMKVGNLEARRDFTDVRDVVRAYWALLTHPCSHAVFNVSSGHILTIRDLITLYEEITGIHVTVAVEPTRSRSGDGLYVAGSNARLVASTGWSPQIPIRRTLGDVFDSWVEEIAAE